MDEQRSEEDILRNELEGIIGGEALQGPVNHVPKNQPTRTKFILDHDPSRFYMKDDYIARVLTAAAMRYERSQAARPTNRIKHFYE